MHLQDRDYELFRWMNGFGYVDIETVQHKWKVTYDVARARLKKLADAELLQREMSPFGFTFFKPTPRALRYAEDELSPMRKLLPTTIVHDKIVAILSLWLEAVYKAKYEPERRMRKRLGIGSKGKLPYIADGLLWCTTKQLPIAIEVELTDKSHARLQSIIMKHVADHKVSEVWYFVQRESQINKIKSLIDETDQHKFKLYELSKHVSRRKMTPYMF